MPLINIQGINAVDLSIKTKNLPVQFDGWSPPMPGDRGRKHPPWSDEPGLSGPSMTDGFEPFEPEDARETRDTSQQQIHATHRGEMEKPLHRWQIERQREE